MSESLGELKGRMRGHFGKITRWRLLCKEQDAATEEEQIRLAHQVLAGPSTGTVAEWHSHWARLNGAETITVEEFLGRRAAGEGS